MASGFRPGWRYDLTRSDAESQEERIQGDREFPIRGPKGPSAGTDSRWSNRRLNLGGWYAAKTDKDGTPISYGEDSIAVNNYATMLGKANYVGPKWETKDVTATAFDDHGVQGCLLSYDLTLKEQLISDRDVHDIIVKTRPPFDITAYEGGPRQLQYKPDWEETKQRLTAWWRHEYFGRCALAVFAPLDRPPKRRVPPEPTTIQEKWYDLDRIAEGNDYVHSRTFFGGEALPMWNAGYPGIAAIPTILGCPLRLDMHTGWHDPLLTDSEGFDVRALRLDEAHPAHRYHMAVLERAVRESAGKSVPSLGAFYQGGDTLAALRGSEQLLCDCAERPEVVRDAENWLMEMWCNFYDRSYAVVHGATQGSACWMGLWAPGKTYTVSNDFSYNISTAMFRDLFLPAIERQTRFLDYSIHHVDGVAAFRHVGALCELPRLHALQILPGAGKPSPLHYMDVLKQVQAAGKNLHLDLAPEEIQPALENLSARGLCINVRCCTEQEARELLQNVERWSVDRG